MGKRVFQYVVLTISTTYKHAHKLIVLSLISLFCWH